MSNNVDAIVELYDKITIEDDTVNKKQLSKSSKNEKSHVSRKKKKNRKKKEETVVKEEGLEEIKLVKVRMVLSTISANFIGILFIFVYVCEHNSSD